MGIFVNKYLDNKNAELYVKAYSKLTSVVEPINFLSRGSDEIFVSVY